MTCTVRGVVGAGQKVTSQQSRKLQTLDASRHYGANAG